MKACCLALAVAFAACGGSAGGSGASSGDAGGDVAPAAGGAVWLAFAADFAAGGTCGDEPSGGLGAAGCDIYRARLEPSTYAVVSVERLTSDPSPEVFPSVAPGGGRVYFHTLDSTTARSIGVVDAASHARAIVLSGAQYPVVLGDGTRLVFTDVAQGNRLAAVTLDATGATASAHTTLTSLAPAQDADAARSGGRLVFHVPGSGAAHGVYTLDPATGTTAPVTTASGVGHCALSPSGARAVCDDANGGGLRAWDLSGATPVDAGVVVADPANLGASDADYAICGATSVDFPSFCDDTHLAVSVSCVQLGAGILFSKVFLADLAASPPRLRALGAELAAKFAGPGHTSWTPSCRAEP